MLRRHGLKTRRKRLSLVAGYAAPPEPAPREPEPERHLEAKQPGALVQFDCFHVGRLSGTKGAVWQYTAIDVASAYTWAELHVTPRNPSAKWTSHLARRVASDLAARGWELDRVMTDNGSEFRSREFGATVAELGAEQRFIRAGRPQTNGCVERVQGTILEECWKPAFARRLIPKQTGLPPRPRALPALLQRGPRPHRPLDPRPHPRERHRQGQAMVLTHSAMCRLILEIEQVSQLP